MWTNCCRHKCFPVCPGAQHLLRTQIVCPGHKNVSDFVQKHFVSAANVSQFARARKHHEQQCVRNNVSSFASTFTGNQRNSNFLPHDQYGQSLGVFKRENYKCIRNGQKRNLHKIKIVVFFISHMWCYDEYFVTNTSL